MINTALTNEERHIVETLKNGGTIAHAQFFNAQRDNLKRLARFRIDRRLTRRIDESDIIQEAFLEYCRRVEKYTEDPQVSPEVWLRGLVRQVISRQNRDNLGAKCRDVRREKHALSSTAINIDELSTSMSSVYSGLVRDELQAKLKEILSKMTTLESEILTLVHFEERTVRDAAIELGISLEAAKKRYRRAVNRLREISQPALSEFK